MRRKDREITSFTEITDILRRTDIIRLGLNGGQYPYIVPLSFGFEAVDGKITMYFHGAKEGLKHDLIAKNNNVCVEADIFHGNIKSPGGITAEYESFIGFGSVERLTGTEAAKGIDSLLEHCGFSGYQCSEAELDATWVYKIEINSFTGKRRFVK